ncbi:hypothetical protein E3N88_32307 [Mikania micrantha]|uniref:CFA20 domain-containing protein n=1 Tax=Mikania micrantha TaxID=192012 RepID=A0A5N6MAS4_9ASTR|nr:hypothetical protein E3N88_32307 [Mikania micrantha]
MSISHDSFRFRASDSILSAVAVSTSRSKPLQIWDKEGEWCGGDVVRIDGMTNVVLTTLTVLTVFDIVTCGQAVNGQVKRVHDEDIQSNILEIVGTNVPSTYITCPADPAATLGIKLPFLVMIVKNVSKYFSFEIQVLDDKNVRRRFRASNFQATTRVKPFICTMPLRMDEGWNQIQLNLGDLTRRAYGTNYAETLRIQVHANCRLRRIYFSDRLYSEEELPPEFRLYLPMQVTFISYPHIARLIS